MRYYQDTKPSVTSVLSDIDGEKTTPLIKWSIKNVLNFLQDVAEHDESNSFYVLDSQDFINALTVSEDITNDAMTIGTIVHEKIERILSNKDYGVSTRAEVNNAFDSFLKFYAKNEIKVVSLERTIIGPSWGGTLDFLGYINGELSIIDWKTGSYRPGYRIQLAAYRHQLQKEIVEEIKKSYIVCLAKDRVKYDLKDVSSKYEKDYLTWLRGLDFFMSKHPVIAKKAKHRFMYYDETRDIPVVEYLENAIDEIWSIASSSNASMQGILLKIRSKCKDAIGER